MSSSMPILAGSVSTAIFIASTLPMLVKAGRTKDLASYSLGNIVLANIGNLTFAVYVLILPIGPVWALHGFHLCATGPDALLVRPARWSASFPTERTTHPTRRG